MNTFLYALKREAEDMLFSLKLTRDKVNVYAAVCPHTNVTFKRAKFNMRKQEAHETAELFITDLHKMADTCDYDDLSEDIIRNRLVVGLLDKKLSEKLQLDAKLTLQKATSVAHDSEVVKRQQN